MNTLKTMVKQKTGGITNARNSKKNINLFAFYTYIIILLFLTQCNTTDCQDYGYDNGWHIDSQGINNKRLYLINNCFINGPVFYFYSNNCLMEYGTEINGKEVHIWYFYDSTGVLVSKKNFDSGKVYRNYNSKLNIDSIWQINH